MIIGAFCTIFKTKQKQQQQKNKNKNLDEKSQSRAAEIVGLRVNSYALKCCTVDIARAVVSAALNPTLAQPKTKAQMGSGILNCISYIKPVLAFIM